MKAVMAPVDNHGNYQITCGHIELVSAYPVNRMAKCLSLMGKTGKLEIFGPDDKLRMTVGIRQHGARRLSEGDDGFTYKAWDESSLKPLREAIENAGPMSQDAYLTVARERTRPNGALPPSGTPASGREGNL